MGAEKAQLLAGPSETLQLSDVSATIAPVLSKIWRRLMLTEAVPKLNTRQVTDPPTELRPP
jgi:hypothetical protein